MSRGGSSGGGQSSLGYLFGSDNETPKNLLSAAPKPTPPYGIDPTDDDKSDQKPKISNNNNYYRAQGQNSGNFVTVSLYFSSYSELIKFCTFFKYEKLWVESIL